jgi:hypothetical protein
LTHQLAARVQQQESRVFFGIVDKKLHHDAFDTPGKLVLGELANLL